MDEIDNAIVNEISSIENSNLHIQIKYLNICTTHKKNTWKI